MLETEYTLYCDMLEPSGLSKSDNIEIVSQYDIKKSENVRHRVRKTVYSNGTTKYTFTTKEKFNNDLSKNIETTVDIDKSKFDSLKEKATLYTEKTRYIFNAVNISMDYSNNILKLPNLKYEVDVFKDENGIDINICKIDIEIDKVIEFIEENYKDLENINLVLKISHLPFKPINPKLNTIKENKSFIDSFYDKINLLK